MKCPNCSFEFEVNELKDLLKKWGVSRGKSIRIVNRWSYLIERYKYLEKELIENQKELENLFEVLEGLN